MSERLGEKQRKREESRSLGGLWEEKTPSSSLFHVTTIQKQPRPEKVMVSIPLPLGQCSGASMGPISGAHLAMVQERVMVAKAGQSRVSAAAASF